MTVVLLPALLGSVAFAVDVAELAHARQRLQSALDSAVLAASRLRDESETRQAAFHSYFDTNISNMGSLSNVVAQLEVSRGLNYIATTGTAEADVVLHFPFIFGGTRRLAVAASAYESTQAIEVAMVLDNTGSMGAARMASLRKAATTLADILEDAKSDSREVKAALVPFVTAVNVRGEGFNAAWIDWDARASTHGANFAPRTNHLTLFEALGLEWKGCVEARPAPYNLSDATPDTTRPDTLFVPYFAPDEPGDAMKSGDSGSRYNNSYLHDVVAGTERERQQSLTKYAASTTRHIAEAGPLTTGPNYACPTPIQPLTSDFDKLRQQISKMIHWNGSGTNVSEGLAWGMRVLSPQEPYTGGAPFNDGKSYKAVVVFTDGENNVFGASSETINKSDYGSYGFVDQGRMGSTNRGTALTNVNNMTSALCGDLKNNGVRVFTVLLDADTAANRKLYGSCASSPSDYYPTSDVNQLDAVFRQIGNSISALHITS